MIKNKPGVSDSPNGVGSLEEQLVELKKQLEEAGARAQRSHDGELRAKADYQNLVRRGQEERAQFIKFATRELVQDLLQPLDHLSLAAQQLNDTGLNMVVQQFWQTLNNHSLEEINPVGKPFDINTMEVVETAQSVNESQDQVSQIVEKVVKKGYKLNGEIIQFAKVILK